MIKVKLSQSYRAKRARIKRIPKYSVDAIDVMTKTKAYKFIEFWQRMIRTNALGVRRLRIKTIMAKQRKGFPKPAIPLYGLGDGDTHTYINMMRIFKLKNGYRVAPGRKRHHESGLSLKDLFYIHEFGASITNGFGKGIFIRIPARPTFYLAYKSYLQTRPVKQGDKAVSEAIKEYIIRGKKDRLNRIAREKRKSKKFEE